MWARGIERRSEASSEFSPPRLASLPLSLSVLLSAWFRPFVLCPVFVNPRSLPAWPRCLSVQARVGQRARGLEHDQGLAGVRQGKTSTKKPIETGTPARLPARPLACLPPISRAKTCRGPREIDSTCRETGRRHKFQFRVHDRTGPSRACFHRQGLFDHHSTTFERSLRGLRYSSPEDLREVLGGMKPRFSEVFDAGCGTGLLGPLFRDIAGIRCVCVVRSRRAFLAGAFSLTVLPGGLFLSLWRSRVLALVLSSWTRLSKHDMRFCTWLGGFSCQPKSRGMRA